MKAAVLLAVVVIVGALVVLVGVVPAHFNAKLEGIAIGEEAGKVMWRAGAFYEASGRFPADANELRMSGAAVAEYRLYDSDERRRIDLAYSVKGGEVTVRHESGQATFAAVLEQGKVARWHLKETTYSRSARAPIEFGAGSAMRCLEPSMQSQPDCKRFATAREPTKR